MQKAENVFCFIITDSPFRDCNRRKKLSKATVIDKFHHILSFTKSDEQIDLKPLIHLRISYYFFLLPILFFAVINYC